MVLISGVLVAIVVSLRITSGIKPEQPKPQPEPAQVKPVVIQTAEPRVELVISNDPVEVAPAEPEEVAAAEFDHSDHEANVAELLAIAATDPENITPLIQTAAEEPLEEKPDPADFGIIVEEPSEPVAEAPTVEEDKDPVLRGGASVQGTLPNGEPVTIADFDSKRLAKMKPRHNKRHTKFDQKGAVKEDGERLRFDGDNDFFSIYDNLELGDHKNIDLSFELEFDRKSKSERSDLTVFWGAEDRQHSYGRGNISSAWTGYELKLGGPGINHVAYKHGGHDLTSRGSTPETFEPGKKYKIEIEQRDGDITLKIDGDTVYERNAIPRTGERAGFGLLFYQASGWVGPVKISTSN